jgi:AmpD protein
MRYSLDSATGLIQPAQFIESPNQDDRPQATTIDLLVVHGISLPEGQFGGNFITDLFLNRLDSQAHSSFTEIAPLKVSSHLLIRRDGSVLQYVPLHKRAWHAGASSFAGRERCNDFSIGIELEGTDTIAYTAEQYYELSHLAVCLMKHYNDITCEHIVGHSDIAPGRKTDPGPAFDWQYFRQLLKRITP